MINVEDEATRSFETSGTTYPATQSHIQEDRSPGLQMFYK